MSKIFDRIFSSQNDYKIQVELHCFLENPNLPILLRFAYIKKFKILEGSDNGSIWAKYIVQLFLSY